MALPPHWRPLESGSLEGALQPIAPPDLDGDGEVSFADLIVVLSAWGQCDGSGCAGDVAGDGAVGFPDIIIVLSAWDSCG